MNKGLKDPDNIWYNKYDSYLKSRYDRQQSKIKARLQLNTKKTKVMHVTET